VDPPEFDEEPGPSTNSLGEGTTVLYAFILVNPEGFYNVHWEWSADDDVYTPISGYTGTPLLGAAAIVEGGIPSFNSLTAGYYKVVVSNEGGTIESTPCQLTVTPAEVIVPPEFDDIPGPSAQTIESNIPVNYWFTLVDPDGFYNIQWKWSADDDVYTNIFGATGSQLYGISSASSEPPVVGNTTSGYYKAVVENEAGTITSVPVQLTVTGGQE
jgi:hypothetical protein